MSANRLEENSKLDVVIQNIDFNNPDEIRMMAKVYEDSFSGYFLGHMGRKFLELLITEFVNTIGNYGYAAKFKDEPIGFILATTSNNPFNKFYRKHFLEIVIITVVRYFKDPFIRKHIGRRWGHIHNALKTFFPIRKTENIRQEEKVYTLVPPRLLAIAVESNYRGLGVANKLTGQFCTEMRTKGFKKVALSALPWNKRAIGFYKKDGWIEENYSDSSISFFRVL